MYIIAPATTPFKLFLCEVVTFGGIINLEIVVPASAKSTADLRTVAPTATAAIDAFACDALIVTFVRELLVFIPTVPVEPMKNLSPEFPLTLKTRSESGATATPSDVARTPVVAVKTPATVILFNVEIPDVAFVLPARVP